MNLISVNYDPCAYSWLWFRTELRAARCPNPKGRSNDQQERRNRLGRLLGGSALRCCQSTCWSSCIHVGTLRCEVFVGSRADGTNAFTSTAGAASRTETISASHYMGGSTNGSDDDVGAMNTTQTPVTASTKRGQRGRREGAGLQW